MIENNVVDEKLLIKKRSVKDLADYIKIRSGISPNYSLFLGAGSSVTSGIKTGYQLVEEWRKEIYTRFSRSDYTTPEEAREWLSANHPDWYDQNNEYSSLFEKKFDLPSQRRRFVELQVDRKLPSIGYAYLVELFESKFFDTIFTTNFDDLINEAFYQFSSDRPLLCAHDSSIKGISITSSRPKIIKLHGDYLFDSIKSSLKETESLENNTREKLIEFTKEYGLIFLGYAGNDKSIMDVLKYLLKQDDYLRNGIYWCKKKGDKITPELFKLLSHDKVYWVEIDGFDEFMAELVHELGVELSLGGNQKSTKREKMISNFIVDNYKLEENKYIKKDLTKIKKNSLTTDISSLINELSQSENDDQKIPEEDFKNLLSIDNLIRTKNYDIVEDNIKKLIPSTNDDNIKSKYLSRLISLKEEQNDTKSALEYSDKLIKLDEFNLKYSLLRTNIFPALKDKIIYLKDLLDKFKYSVNLRNHLCNIAISYLELSDSDSELISFKDIHELLDSSLHQDGSLDNDAWRIKYNAIQYEHQSNYDKEPCHNLIKGLIHKIRDINPTHETYLYIYSSFSISTREEEKILLCINELSNEYNYSSKNKKLNILTHLTKLHLALFESDSQKEIPELMEGFINKYENDNNISSIAPFILFKARYEIGCNRNIESGISLAKDAMESRRKSNYIQEIVRILMIDKNNIQLIDDFIDSLPRDTSKITIYKLKSQIYLLKENYEKAIEFIDYAYEEKLDLSSFILTKSYIFLLNKQYEKAIKIINESIDKIKDVREKDMLIINREIAKKELKQEIKKNEILSILSHNKSKGDVAMCAFFLLDRNNEGKNQLKKLIENDYLNYYNYLEWPAVPKSMLIEYSKE